MMRMVRFVSELSQRRVLRLASFYVVGAWLILQIADVTFQPIGLPDWAMRYLVYLVVAGFIPSLILGWRYDLKASRLVRAARPGELESGSEVHLALHDYLVIAGLPLATVAVATIFFLNPLNSATRDLPPPDRHAQVRVIAMSVVSGSSETDSFLRGVAESVAFQINRSLELTWLVGDSAAYLRSNPSRACEIVQPTVSCEIVFIEDPDSKPADRLQIRRINAVTGRPIETSSVLFRIGTPAESITQLCLKLVEVLQPESTVDAEAECERLLLSSDSEALRLYYSALSALFDHSEEQTSRARNLFKSVVQSDPDFGAAHAGYGISLLELVRYPGYPLSAVRREAKDSVFKAKELAPEHWLTHASLAYWHERSGDYQAAADAYSLAVGKTGGSPYLLRRLYQIHDALKNPNEALTIAKRLYRLDGLDASSNIEIGKMALRVGDLSFAESTLTDAVNIEPSNYSAHSKLAEVHFLRQRCEEAEAEYRLGADPKTDHLARFRPENLDFENGTEDWRLSNGTFDFESDTSTAHSGSASGKLAKSDAGKRESGTVWQAIRPCDLQGKRVRLSGYAKTANVENAFNFYISARASPKHPSASRGRQLGGDYMKDREIKGTTDWTKYDLVFEIPKGTIWLGYGATLRGSGTAWIDNLKLEEVDRSVPTTK